MKLKKAAVLIVVLGTMLVLTILALVAVNLMTQESRIAEHKIRRIQAFYAAQGAIVHATERLRRNGTAAATLADINDDDPSIGGIPTDITVSAADVTEPSDFRVRVDADYAH